MVTLSIVKKAFHILSTEGIGEFSYRCSRRLRQSELWFRMYTGSRYRKQRIVYSAPAHPYKVIWINPSNITDFATNISKTAGLGQINDESEWKITPREKNACYMSIKQRYEQGYDWEDTEYGKKAKRRFESGENKGGYESFEEFIELRYGYIDDIFEEIRDEGYKPNYKSQSDFPDKDAKNRVFFHSLEPLVAIGSRGDIYRVDGRHRLAMAEVLDIEVPVYVISRDEKWQQIREDIQNSDSTAIAELYEKYKNHPDLQDIIKNKATIWR